MYLISLFCYFSNLESIGKVWINLFRKCCPQIMQKSLIISVNFLLSNSCVCILFQVYKKKTEAAKKDYLKALAAYRASLVSKVCYVKTTIIYAAIHFSFCYTFETKQLTVIAIFPGGASCPTTHLVSWTGAEAHS